MAGRQSRQSMLSTSPELEADFRSATEAMQRAAEAMIAATESFRVQFRQQDSLPQRPVTFHPYHTVGRASPRHSPPSSSEGRRASLPFPPSIAGSTVLASPHAAFTTHSRRNSGGSEFLGRFEDSQTCLTPVPAAKSLAELLPRRPDVRRPRSDTSTSSGAHRLPAEQPCRSSEAIVCLTPTADWPVINESVPDLASTLAPPSVHTGPGGSKRRVGPHSDLIEAAMRLSRSDTDQGFPRRSDSEEPEPVVQIGRYTYVRSDTDVASGSMVADGPPRKHIRDRQRSNDRPQGFSLFHEIMFVLIISIAQVLTLAGIAQSLVPGRLIGQSFPDTDAGHIAWYSAAYGLTAGTFVLPSGRLGDLFGHKKMFIIGFVWFALWSLIAGFAEMAQQAGCNGSVFFIISRAFQGLGPAMLVPNGQALLGRTYKPGTARKNLVMCLYASAAPLGFVVGAAMSSLFAAKASWPWAFWTLAAVCCAFAAVSVLILPATEKTKRNSTESIWLQMDIWGMGLGVSGLILFNFAFNQAPVVSWSTPYTYFLLVIGIMLLAAFVYTEMRVAPHPLVPIAAMRSTANFVLGCTGAGWGCFSVWVFYAVSFLEVLRGWSPLLTSAGLAQGPISGLAASLLTGYLMTRVKPHWIMLISMLAFFIGSVLFAVAPVEQSYWFNAFFSVLIMPFGMDMSNPAATILLSDSVSREHQGIAASLVVTTVNYSISLALGIAGTIEAHIVSNGGDVLAGYRAAMYFGVGLGGLGVLLAGAFTLQSYVRRPNGGGKAG